MLIYNHPGKKTAAQAKSIFICNYKSSTYDAYLAEYPQPA
jgi:hypothetical protein